MIYWDFPRRRVTVGMGVRWRHIYPHTQGTGLIPVGGGCPDVGVAGFTLGGGWSWLSREFDGLIEAQIVLANASVITLNGEIAQTSTDYADLWFAIRGAGGGNFGVVTQMTIALHELSSAVGLNGEVCWRLERAREAMLAYPAWLDSLPNEFGAPLIWSQMYGEQRYCVTVVYDGPPATGYELLAPMYALRPDYITLDENDLSNFEVVMDGHGAATNAPGRQYTHSLILPRENYTADFIDLVLAGVHRSPSVQFHEGGGVIDDVAWNATAFPYRDLFGVVQINAIWDSEDDDPENVNWADELYRELAPYAIGAYVNYMNGKLPAGTYNQLYYGPNLPRLQKVKNAVDPTNFFAYPAGLQATVLKTGRGEQEVRPTA